MPPIYVPGLQYQAGVPVSVTDPNDARTPTKTVPVPMVASIATDATGAPIGTPGNPTSTQATPTAATAGGITPVVAQGASALLVKAAPGNLYSASMTAGTAAGFFIAYNSATIPAAGATLTSANVLNAAPVAANGLANLGGNPFPDTFATGIVLLFSTTLATYTAPANLAVFMRGSAS